MIKSYHIITESAKDFAGTMVQIQELEVSEIDTSPLSRECNDESEALSVALEDLTDCNQQLSKLKKALSAKEAENAQLLKTISENEKALKAELERNNSYLKMLSKKDQELISLRDEMSLNNSLEQIYQGVCSLGGPFDKVKSSTSPKRINVKITTGNGHVACAQWDRPKAGKIENGPKVKGNSQS
jgi:HD superfamily phosphohydrolase